MQSRGGVRNQEPLKSDIQMEENTLFLLTITKRILLQRSFIKRK